MPEPLVHPFRTNRIIFLGEQDGPSERLLKDAVAEVLKQDSSVLSAYLLRISYSATPGLQIALCLNGGEVNEEILVPKVALAFKKIFARTVHVDIFFCSQAQLPEIDRVAKPFYRRQA